MRQGRPCRSAAPDCTAPTGVAAAFYLRRSFGAVARLFCSATHMRVYTHKHTHQAHTQSTHTHANACARTRTPAQHTCHTENIGRPAQRRAQFCATLLLEKLRSVMVHCAHAILAALHVVV